MNYKRNRPRSQKCRAVYGMRAGTIVDLTRPMRRRDKTRIHRIMRGADPDGVAWEHKARLPAVAYYD